MKQFQVYLRAELGKLRNKSDAECFLRSVPSEVRSNCGLMMEAKSLRQQFATQEKIDQYVKSLSEDCLRMLSKACDHNWRKNGVFAKLTSSDPWLEADVPIDQVTLQQAEPHLVHIFKRNNFELQRIVTDCELFQHEPYRSQSPDETVAFPTCLAKYANGRYRIFDGMHRAIQLARSGRSTISVCCSVVSSIRPRSSIARDS